jgi:hypothetical protein
MSNQQPFDPKSYYRLANKMLANYTVGTLGSAPLAAVNMTSIGSSSSENWQIYYQSQPGVYFIRNYDAGSQLQLGLTADSAIIPRLLSRAGDLSQQ